MLAQIIILLLIIIIVVILVVSYYYTPTNDQTSLPTTEMPPLEVGKQKGVLLPTPRPLGTPRTPKSVRIVTNSIMAYHIDHNSWQQITTTANNIVYQKLFVDHEERIWIHDIHTGIWANRTGAWRNMIGPTRAFGAKSRIHHLTDVQYSNNNWVLLYSTPTNSVLCNLQGEICIIATTEDDEEMYVLALHSSTNGILVTARVAGKTGLWWRGHKKEKFIKLVSGIMPDNRCSLSVHGLDPFVSYFDYQGENQLYPAAVNVFDVNQNTEHKNIGNLPTGSTVHDVAYNGSRLIILYSYDNKCFLLLLDLDEKLRITQSQHIVASSCTADSKLLLYRSSLMVVTNKL